MVIIFFWVCIYAMTMKLFVVYEHVECVLWLLISCLVYVLTMCTIHVVQWNCLVCVLAVKLHWRIEDVIHKICKVESGSLHFNSVFAILCYSYETI